MYDKIYINNSLADKVPDYHFIRMIPQAQFTQRKFEDTINNISKDFGIIYNQAAQAENMGFAKRAAWLGNDETHYVRKHEHMTVNDLKRLIDLTIHWIMMEQLTDDYERDLQ